MWALWNVNDEVDAVLYKWIWIFSNQVLNKQRHLERNYSNLKQLASEKNQRLIEVIKLYKLHFEIEDLEQWIAQREIIASSQDYGQNFENVLVITIFKLYYDLIWFDFVNVFI